MYSVTLGVALALAVEQVIDPERSGVPVRSEAVLPFLAFLVTAFSLYHWAARFVDVSHTGTAAGGSAAIVTTLVVGSTELVLLIASAILISRPTIFLVVVVGVFAFEALAGAALLKARAYGEAEAFARRYLVINGVAAIAGTVAVLVEATSSRPGLVGAIAAVLAWGRAIAFYKVGFALLFQRRAD